MFKANVVIGLLMLALFTNAQYRGWSLFDSTPTSAPRAAGQQRAYHK